MKWLREKLNSWLLPEPISFYHGVELRRCQADGQIVTMQNLQHHAGHFIKQPVVLTKREKLFIWLKLIQ